MADQVLADLLGQMARFLLWELIFGRPSVGRSTPLQMAISQVPPLTAHISFLLWELIFGRPVVADLPLPPSNGHISGWAYQIPSLLIFDQVLADLTPSHISCSDYFMPTLRAHIWQTLVLADLPPIKWQFHRFLLWQFIFHSHSWVLIFGRPGWADLPLPLHQTATIDSYSESSYLADQVLADLPPSNGNFTGSCSDSSYFISFSESWYLADQLWTDLSPHQMVISQIAALTPHISFLLWGLIFGRPGVGRSTPCIK